MTISCSRCKREAAAMTSRPPLPPASADEVLANVCEACWQEWRQNEVMVINELRLNFMDPGAAEILHRHMREFLGLAPPGSAHPPSTG